MNWFTRPEVAMCRYARVRMQRSFAAQRMLAQMTKFLLVFPSDCHRQPSLENETIGHHQEIQTAGSNLYHGARPQAPQLPTFLQRPTDFAHRHLDAERCPVLAGL